MQQFIMHKPYLIILPEDLGLNSLKRCPVESSASVFSITITYPCFRRIDPVSSTTIITDHHSSLGGPHVTSCAMSLSLDFMPWPLSPLRGSPQASRAPSGLRCPRGCSGPARRRRRPARHLSSAAGTDRDGRSRTVRTVGGSRGGAEDLSPATVRQFVGCGKFKKTVNIDA